MDDRGGSLLYQTLQKNSLKAATVDHGLQYNGIYWETGHRTWLTFFQPLCHKFSWKWIDDTIRRLLRFTTPVTDINYIFYDRQHRIRYDHGAFKYQYYQHLL